MIKPATPLPWSFDENKINASSLERGRIRGSNNWIAAECSHYTGTSVKNNETLSADCQYIVTACNEFKAGVELIKKFKAVLEDEGYEMTTEYLEVRDFLARCGVKP